MRFFLLVLVVFAICSEITHAMTRDGASRICQASVDRLKAEKVTFSPNIQSAYNAILENLEGQAQKLRILEKPGDIGDARKNCDRGARAAEWLIETFGKTRPIRVEDENQESKATKEKSDKSDEKEDKKEKPIKAKDEVDKSSLEGQGTEKKKEDSSFLEKNKDSSQAGESSKSREKT